MWLDRTAREETARSQVGSAWRSSPTAGAMTTCCGAAPGDANRRTTRRGPRPTQRSRGSTTTITATAERATTPWGRRVLGQCCEGGEPNHPTGQAAVLHQQLRRGHETASGRASPARGRGDVFTGASAGDTLVGDLVAALTGLAMHPRRPVVQRSLGCGSQHVRHQGDSDEVGGSGTAGASTGAAGNGLGTAAR